MSDAVQLLRPDGHRSPHPDYAFSGTMDEIGVMYRATVLMRRIDTESFALQRKGELALWTPAVGQEAAQIGSALALRHQDYVFPSYRETALAWLLGVDLASVMGLWRTSSFGSWDPAVHRCAPLSIVVGSHPLHATGYAIGVALDGAVATGDDDRDIAVLTYFGDGASSQGDVMEAMALAGLNRAPVVFFCQNNQYAISLPVRRQSAAPIHQRAAGFGFPGVQVDGNDVLACHAVTTAALDRARSGGGPTLIEAVTYRMGPHTTSDDSTRYRSADEVDAWRDRDPIDRVRTLLEGHGFASDFFADVDAESDDLAVKVRSAVSDIADPDLADQFDRLYVEPSDELGAQRDAFVAWRSQYEVQA